MTERPVLAHEEARYRCRFGEIDVPVKLVQPGVFKCHAPPYANEPGFVDIAMVFDENIIATSTNSFEYREPIFKPIGSKRKRSAEVVQNE